MISRKQVFCGLAVVWLFANVVNAEVAYVSRNRTHECATLPKNDICPGDIMVLKNVPSLNSSLEAVEKYKSTVNQSCYDAMKKFTCAGVARCTPTRVSVDVDTWMSLCQKGKALCPNTLASMFNCTNQRANYEQLNKDGKAAECKKVKDNTGTCPELKYKWAHPYGDNYTAIFQQVKAKLQQVKPNLTSECYETVKKTACVLIANICSDDGKYVVSLINKEKCLKNMKCAPDKFGLTTYCEDLPEAKTAKRVELEGPTNAAPFTNPATWLVSIIAFLFM